MTNTSRETSVLIARVTALAIRRIRICKAAIPCPKCGTRQIYLYDHAPLAEWKCRECRHRWWFEPLTFEQT